MSSKALRAALATSVFMTTAASQAGASDLGAALVGGIIGGIITNEAQKNQRKPARTSTRSSTQYNATRAANRETQTALNYFAFPAGTPDGVMGRRSRSAISQYQVFMGFPATGHLTPYERDFLVTSFSRAQIGGPQVIKAAQGPNGVRSLLHSWRDESFGSAPSAGYAGLPIEVSEAVDEIAESAEPTAEQLLQRSGFIQLADMNGDGKNDYMIDTSVSGSSFWCGASHCTVMVFASTPDGYQRNDFLGRGVTPASFSCHRGSCQMNEGGNPVVTAEAAPAPAAPGTVLAAGEAPSGGLGGITLFDTPQATAPQASLTSHCSKVSLLTSSGGGYMTVSNMTDPELALGEQFCLARSYAINSGEGVLASLQGVSQAQVDSQCDQFGPAVQPYLAQLTSQNAVTVMANVQKFILQSNMSIEQLRGTAQICLLSGYRRDNMDVALGAALIMTGLGERPYAELIAHHTALGFGVAPSVNRAQDWYAVAVAALEGGSDPVFAPGQPERVALIKLASERLGGAPQLVKPVPASGQAPALPSFNLGD